MPLTKGSSGPTRTISILFFITSSLIAKKSFTLISKFTPSSLVPAFPGAIKILLTILLLDSFQQKACSLPPPPNIKIFIFKLFFFIKSTVELLKTTY